MKQKIIAFIGGPKDGFEVSPVGNPPFLVDIDHEGHKVRYVLSKRTIKGKQKLCYVPEIG